jgi:hypothetical protein
MSTLNLPAVRVFVSLLFLILMLGFKAEGAFGLDAQHWQRLPDAAKRYYVLGSVETWNEAIRFTSDLSEPVLEGMFDQMTPCIQREKLNVDHLLVSVQKYVDDHSSDRGMEMSAVVFTVVSQGCGQRKGTPSRDH